MKSWLHRIASKLKTPESAGQEALNNAIERNREIRIHGETKGRLLFALQAVVDADDGQAMEAQDIKVLADMARRYLDGLDCYPGELGDADLLMQKRDAFGKSNREAALYRLIKLRQQGYPLDGPTYDLAANEYGLSRSTLDRYEKERRSKKMIAPDGQGGLIFGTLSSMLKRKRKS